MVKQPFTVGARLADVLKQPGPPFQNWLAELGKQLALLLEALAQLTELVVSKCDRCGKPDSALWLRVGDHRMCDRLSRADPDEPLPPSG